MFADAEDERNQYTIVIHQVATRLRLDAVPAGDSGAVKIDGDLVTTYEQLVDVIAARLIRRRHPRGLGRAGHRRWGRSTRSSGGCGRRCGRCGRSSAPT